MFKMICDCNLSNLRTTHWVRSRVRAHFPEQRLVIEPTNSQILRSRNYKGNGYKHLAQGFLGSFGFWPIMTDACPPTQSQKSLHPKLVPILPRVSGVGNWSIAKQEMTWRFNNYFLFLLQKPFYVRCIKPNDVKSSSVFDEKRVGHQVRREHNYR